MKGISIPIEGNFGSFPIDKNQKYGKTEAERLRYETELAAIESAHREALASLGFN